MHNDRVDAASADHGNAASRLRRDVSAARAACTTVAAESLAADNADLHDDVHASNSLVLCTDRSTISAQRSRGSVLSGAHQQGETFFTALKRQTSWRSDKASNTYLDDDNSTCMGSELCDLSSTHCSEFQFAGTASAAGNLLDDEAEDIPSSEQHEGNSVDAPHGQLTASVLDVINSLYGSQAAAPLSSQPWHQTPADPDPADTPEPPAMDTAGTSDSTTPQQGDNTEVHTDAPSGEPCEVSSVQQQGDQETGTQQELLTKVVTAADSVADADADADTCTPLHVESSTASSHGGCSSPHVQAEGQTTPVETGPSTTATRVPSADVWEDVQDEQQSLPASEGAQQADRSKMHEELSGYLQQLNSMEDEEGHPLVQLTEDYHVLVERLLREGRAQQYRAFDGWDGPRRFEDLPVAQLSTQSKDPEVAAGLAAIKKLDEELREASLKALISARALNPERWADEEKRRLHKRAAELDATLMKERQRRAHAAKLRNALTRLDAQCSEASLQSTLRGNAGLSYYQLTPQQEELLACVLSRDEATLDANNPFDPHLLPIDDIPDSTTRPCSDLDANNPFDPHLLPMDDIPDSTTRPCSDQQSGMETAAPSAVCESLESSCTPAGDAGSLDDTCHCSADDAILMSKHAAAAAAEQAVGINHDSQVASQDRPRTSTASETPTTANSISRTGSCLSSSVFTLLRPSNSHSQGRRRSLADIDAQLQAIASEREAAQQGRAGLLSRSTSSSTSRHTATSSQGASTPPHTSHSTPSRIPSAPGSTSAPADGDCRHSLIPRHPDISAAAAASPVSKNSQQHTKGPDGRAGSCHLSSSSSLGHRRMSASSRSGSFKRSGTEHPVDYIRQQREVKELMQREREVDVQLRALQTGEVPTTLTPQQLSMLLQCAY